MQNLATQHKTMAYRMIDTLGVDVTVRQPAVRTTSTNTVEKIFGVDGAEEAYGTSTTVTGHVHQGVVPPDAAGYNQTAQFLGMLQNADLVVSVKLEDVLVTATEVYGRTIFDTAKDVVVSGSAFQVVGTFRSGLAPLGPYLLWVGLQIEE